MVSSGDRMLPCRRTPEKEEEGICDPRWARQRGRASLGPPSAPRAYARRYITYACVRAGRTGTATGGEQRGEPAGPDRNHAT